MRLFDPVFCLAVQCTYHKVFHSFFLLEAASIQTAALHVTFGHYNTSLHTCVCTQVSSGGGVLSRLVHLQIAVPEAFILGADEHHVDAGSTINLVCIIEKVRIFPRSPSPPAQYSLP